MSNEEAPVYLAPQLAQLTVARGRLFKQATVAAQVPLEPSAVQLLWLLRDATGPRRIGEIAAAMQVEGPHVTRTVQRLQNKGLVERVVDSSDRRARHIAITPAGAKAVDRYRRVVVGWLQDALAGWSEHDRQELARLTGRLAEDLLTYLQDLEGLQHTG